MRLFLALAFVGVLSGCSTKAKLVAQGGECLQATDCEDGLVCVPQDDGKRVCSSDLSGVQMVEEAAAPPPRDGGGRDARRDATGADVEPPDADQSDTGGSGDAPAD